MSKRYTLLTFKGICMNFLLKLNFFIFGHPVTSKQPHKIVQILLVHPVLFSFDTFNSFLAGLDRNQLHTVMYSFLGQSFAAFWPILLNIEIFCFVYFCETNYGQIHWICKTFIISTEQITYQFTTGCLLYYIHWKWYLSVRT